MKTRKQFAIRVHPAGAVMFALALLFLPSRKVLAAAAALLWHEGAHLLAMKLCGLERCMVELTPFGGMADADAFEKLPAVRQAVCAVAGVAASAAGAGCMIHFGWETPFCAELMQAHLSLLLMNVLPVWPLDGARAVMALAIRLGCENGMRRALSRAARLLGILLAGLGLYGAWMGSVNLSLLLAGPYLCYAASFSTTADHLRRIQLSEQKLTQQPVWEARLLAGREGNMHAWLPGVISRLSSGRYLLFCELDQNGCVKRLWTEKEMVEALLNKEGIAARSK